MTAVLTTRQIDLRPALRWGVVVVGFVMSVLLSSNDAFATCGDYLHSRNMKAHHPMAGHDAVDGESSQKPTVPVRTPCQGPQCQNREHVPIAPMTVPTSVAQRTVEDALPSFVLTHSLDVVRQGVEYHEAALSASDGFVSRLERPPR